MSTEFSIWTAAFLTLCIFSFLYRDNPFYRFAEHLIVGVTAGYLLCLTWFEIIKPELVLPLMEKPLNLRLFPAILTVFMLMRLSKKTQWIGRWPIALVVGLTAGISIPQTLQAKVFEQIRATLEISLFSGSIALIFGKIILVGGTLCALLYFYFSSPQKGAFGVVTRIGIYVLMVGFGASFGYTVMARLSLLIGRVLFLLRDWLGLIE